MNTSISRGATAIALAALLSGCTGAGGSTRSVLPSNPSPAQGASSVAMTVVIPQKTASSSLRAPQYLPATTKSMAVTVNAGAAQIVGLQPTDPGCSTVGGNTVCNAKILAPIGSDTFDLTAYDAAGATGNKLSHLSVTKAVVAGTNSFPLVLNGVVASVSLSLASTSSKIYEGAANSTATANVVALDHDNNTIMGTYDKPVSVTGSGTFAGTAATVTASGGTVTLHYNGTDPANVGATTFTATAGGAAVPLTTSGTIVSNPTNLAVVTPPGTTSVALWYDAADASSVTLGAGPSVAAWKDKSGNAADVTLTAGNPAPTYPDTSIPGTTHAFMDFTPGTPASAGPPAVPATPGAFLSRATGFPANDYSIFAVAYNTQANASGTGSGGAILGGTTGHGLLLTGPGTLCLYEANNDCTAQQAAITATNPSFANVTYRVTGLYSNASGAQTGTISINGATAPPAFASNPAPPRVADTNVVVNGYKLDGLTSGTNSIGEIIVLDHVATPAEQAAIESYLKAKWGLTQ